MNSEILKKLDTLLKAPAMTFDPTPFLLAGTQILFKFEEVHAHVKGLTKKLDTISAICEENARQIAALKQDMVDVLAADPFGDLGS